MTEHRRIKGDPRLGFALSGDPEFDEDVLATVEIAKADIAREIREAIKQAEEGLAEVDVNVRQREGLAPDDEDACLHYRSEDYESYDNQSGVIDGLNRALKI